MADGALAWLCHCLALEFFILLSSLSLSGPEVPIKASAGLPALLAAPHPVVGTVRILDTNAATCGEPERPPLLCHGTPLGGGLPEQQEVDCRLGFLEVSLTLVFHGPFYPARGAALRGERGASHLSPVLLPFTFPACKRGLPSTP